MNITYKKIVSYIKTAIPLLHKPYLINAYVSHDDSGHQISANWGDDLNGTFLSSIIDGRTYDYTANSLANRWGMENYLVIGSTIDLRGNSNSIVWGAGIIDGDMKLKYRPKEIRAVRGPLTRRTLIAQGLECPEIFGDPAMLVPLYYQPKMQKKYKWGIIPHNTNNDYVTGLKIDGISVSERDDVLIINMGKYEYWQDIPDMVCSCESIISESLHGLIIAEAYKIPNLWVVIGKGLIGGYFKFHDFFLSINRDREQPFIMKECSIQSDTLDALLSKWESGHIELSKLFEASPFPLKRHN